MYIILQEDDTFNSHLQSQFKGKNTEKLMLHEKKKKYSRY